MLRVEVGTAQTRRFEQEVELLKQRISEVRRWEARSQYEKLREYAKSVSSQDLKAVADRNADWAKENEKVVAKITSANGEIKLAQERLETLRESEQRSRQRVERIGMSGATGLDLRKQLSRLPDVHAIHRSGDARNELMREVESNRLDHEETLAELKRQVLPADAEADDQKVLKDSIEVLGDLGKNYDKYFQQLSDLDFAENQLIDEATVFRSFLNQRVLWIRSSGWLGWDVLRESWASIRELTRPEFLAGIGRSMLGDAIEQPTFYVLGFLAAVLLMPARYRGRRPLAELGKAACRPNCTNYWLTVRAALLTTTMSFAWPLVLLFLGYRLSVATGSDAPIVAVGRGLMAMSVMLASLNLVRHACREGGLAINHFGWQSRVARLLRRKLIPMVYLGMPLTFFVVTTSEQETATTSDGLQRICSIVGLSLVAWVLYELLHEKRGVLVENLNRNQNSWAARTQVVWFWFIVGFPVAMIVLIVIGYTYTASELTWRFWNTLWILATLVAVREFAIRGLQINYRVVRMEKLRLKRESHEHDSSQGNQLLVVGDALTLEEEQEAIRTSGQQVLRVLHSGLWLVGALSVWLLWSGIVPALSILDQWTLWDTTRDVVVEKPLGDGRIGQVTESVVESITMVNILAACFFSVVTFTLVRNAPGLIDILILQRLPLEPSFKFAIAMMCRYVILVIGILLIFSTIGFSWSKLQWLVAALTVGLGFGLQEIFGNFVSGIIILWERPIRIGDVVTLDGVSGTVSRIQMRATTITDWDHKEYIVPNKDFVTGRLLNWTRSDQVSRVVIKVGVAYGSDVVKAMEILKGVAVSHPRIMSDPEPSVTFDSFGDSTLDLTLRCFLPDLDNRLQTISEMHLSINQQYADAGVEIAFPQQDLHIRSMPDDLAEK